MTDFENVPDVLTVSELQKVLRIGRSTAYRLIKANEIQSIRIGRSIRVPKSSVIDYVSPAGGPIFPRGRCPRRCWRG